MSPSVRKYVLFFVSLVLLVGLDLWTKDLAERRLASQRPGLYSHNMVLEVPEAFHGKELLEYLNDELGRNSEEEVREIASRFTVNADGRGLSPTSVVSVGETIEIRHREVVVIDGYWDFQYARNPGAAFGFMADADESFRRPFLLIVSLIALLVILGMLRTVRPGQHILFWALTLIAAGALGNMVDRVRFGYVIDFVVWKVGDEYRWPTFNVADVLICVGVGLMIVELIREGMQEYREKKAEKAEA